MEGIGKRQWLERLLAILEGRYAHQELSEE
jgi:hypothetical protein